MSYSHNVKSMVALASVTEQFLASLPAEFTKKEFEALRKSLRHKHPLSLQTCRDYGFVVVVRTEPSTYTKEESVWVDTKGRQFTYDEMNCMDRNTIATLFDCPKYAQSWMSLYCLPYQDIPVQHDCVRNIFRVDMEKFKRFLAENA